MKNMATNHSNNPESERAETLEKPSPPAKPAIYPEISPRYWASLKWLALIFVAFVLWVAFHSGYS